jgi:hypothetical protein
MGLMRECLILAHAALIITISEPLLQVSCSDVNGCYVGDASVARGDEILTGHWREMVPTAVLSGGLN